VRDQGHGIEPELLPRIFDPYFTTKENGSGLGLASCHAIVKNHGGRITVESKPGEGTVFHLLIPAAEERPEPGETAGEAGDMPRGEGRILVVDDEEAIREVLRDLLESMGYEAVTCADGHEAVRLVEETTAFDAAILDLTIPGGLGGRELCGLIREKRPSLPTIAASGYSDDPVMARPEEFGFAATLAKPFSGPDLARALRAALA
jgi:CheY-like chemotaxis protein